jgi:hypothetical protein
MDAIKRIAEEAGVPLDDARVKNAQRAFQNGHYQEGLSEVIKIAQVGRQKAQGEASLKSTEVDSSFQKLVQCRDNLASGSSG